MQVNTSSATKLVLTGLMESHGIDPVCIFLEDYGPGKGKVTVECYGKAWSSYWPAMGERSVAEFFVGCAAGYVAKKFGQVEDRTYDWDAISDQLGQRTGSEVYITNEVELVDYRTELEAIWGNDWWNNVPKRPHPDYVYLCKIIAAAQEGVREWMGQPQPDSQEVSTSFLGAVTAMRQAQRQYFSTRDKTWLDTSKGLEKRVDQYLDGLARPGLF